jgi:hypothetical protein
MTQIRWRVTWVLAALPGVILAVSSAFLAWVYSAEFRQTECMGCNEPIIPISLGLICLVSVIGTISTIWLAKRSEPSAALTADPRLKFKTLIAKKQQP